MVARLPAVAFLPVRPDDLDRLAALVVIAGAWLLALPAFSSAQSPQLAIETRVIDRFGASQDAADRSAPRFLGGLEITSDDSRFGGLSGLRIKEQGSRLFAVSDTALWFTAIIERDPEGRLGGLSMPLLSCLCRRDGTPYGNKHWGDSEALEISGNKAWVAFERLNRINVYSLDGRLLPESPSQAVPSFRPFDIAYNEGLEALARFPDGSHLQGHFIAIAEESPNARGDHRAFIASADDIREFAIGRSDGYSITDATFLPSGDLLILERKFGWQIGLHMRIRRLDPAAISPGVTLEGETILEASLSSGIDNMEGISAWKNAAGETIVTLVSDDNFNSIQRTILLEFLLQGE